MFCASFNRNLDVFSEHGAEVQKWKGVNGRMQMDGDCSYMPVSVTKVYTNDHEIYFPANGMTS